MPPVEKKICSRTLPIDILSNLPDDVLDDILMRMPLPDVVRTSILSKKWRYKWKKPYKLPASFFNCVHLRHLSLEDCHISHPQAFIGFDRLIFLKLYNITISYTLLGSLISHCPLLEQLVLLLPDNFNGVIEIIAPKLKSLDFTGRVWFISLKIVPLLEQVSLAFRGGFFLESKPHYTRVLESFCTVEHLHLDNHSLKVDNSDVPIALDNIDLEGSFGETTFNNLSIIMIRSIRGTNLHMQLLKLLLEKSPALTRIIIEALTYEDYEILKSVIEHSEFRCASPDAEVVFNYYYIYVFFDNSGTLHVLDNSGTCHVLTIL
uniref:FBD-associated F-box protein At2g26860-like n=2 Tax=Nicotiana sylvestris TaxID=4096 RepID=A0A1U7X1X8_NICSY|nr:PREDICTED: FBD-associated F-box protein At2g26860-like [Nicotiana sylvestris]